MGVASQHNLLCLLEMVVVNRPSPIANNFLCLLEIVVVN